MGPLCRACLHRHARLNKKKKRGNNVTQSIIEPLYRPPMPHLFVQSVHGTAAGRRVDRAAMRAKSSVTRVDASIVAPSSVVAVAAEPLGPGVAQPVPAQFFGSGVIVGSVAHAPVAQK